MNGNKQSREAIVLAGTMAILLIIAIFTFKGMMGGSAATPAPPAPAEETSTSAKKTPVKVADNNGNVPWLDNNRVPRLVEEVKGGRNPFLNLLMDKEKPSTPPAPTPPSTPHTPTASPGPGSMPFQPSDIKLSCTRTLQWTTPQVLAQEFKAASLPDITLAAGKAPRQIVLSGYSPEYEKAVEIIKQTDVPPPIPHFVLAGVITTPSQRFAAILLDGKQYSLLDGESIPGLGWTVKRITPTGVTLTKGVQSVQLRLSGGSPS